MVKVEEAFLHLQLAGTEICSPRALGSQCSLISVVLSGVVSLFHFKQEAIVHIYKL